MDDEKTLVLCIAEVTRRWGNSTFVYTDSVMLEVRCAEQVYPYFQAHYASLCRQVPGLIRWKMTTYLPQKPLKSVTIH